MGESSGLRCMLKSKFVMNKIFCLFTAVQLSVTVYGQQPKFNARGLFALSDADSDLTSLMDTEHKSQHLESSDKLHLIRFPLETTKEQNLREFPISNSIFSTSSIVEISTTTPRLAYILETKGAATNDGLASGSFISVLDISSLDSPKALFRFSVATNPTSIALSPDNQYLAVASEEAENEIQVIEVNADGKPLRKIKKPNTLGADKISHVCWSPDGKHLIYTNETKKEIGVIDFLLDNPTEKLGKMRQSGQPIQLGLLPSFGQFTSDGKYYVVSDLKQSKTSAADKTAALRLEPAEIFVIKFNFDTADQPYLLSKQAVGVNLESFLIHPNGNTIFALSSEQSFDENVILSEKTSAKLHLLSLSDSGVLSNVATYPIRGRYPSGLTIDSTGQNLAVSIAEYENYGLKFGGVQFWQFTSGTAKKLTKQPTDYYLPKGIHYLKAIY